MKRFLVILISIFAYTAVFAQKNEQRSDWLTYSLEVKMPGISQEELFDRCRYIYGNYLGPESFSRCDWDFENHIKRYDFDWNLFEYRKNKYNISYKVFISCVEEEYSITMGFIKAYIHNSWGNNYIFRYDYLTEGKDGVRGGIAHSTYQYHDKIIREHILPDLFKEICTSIKADMMIQRN